jgi:hypothetical protein
MNVNTFLTNGLDDHYQRPDYFLSNILFINRC